MHDFALQCLDLFLQHASSVIDSCKASEAEDVKEEKEIVAEKETKTEDDVDLFASDDEPTPPPPAKLPVKTKTSGNTNKALKEAPVKKEEKAKKPQEQPKKVENTEDSNKESDFMAELAKVVSSTECLDKTLKQASDTLDNITVVKTVTIRILEP